MKKSNFIALVLGTVGGILFALGMCMTLLPEWNAFQEGIIFGAAGMILWLITVFVWRKMENKAPLRLDRKTIGAALLTIAGLVLLGVGMCFCMVWEKLVPGTLIGIAGIVALLALIPVVKGLK